MESSFDLESLHSLFNEDDETRLFRVGVNRYAQYSRKEPFPVEIYDYMKTHQGNRPPYIQLPDYEAFFDLSTGSARPEKIKWPGKGPLPPQVLEYITEHGVLPHPSAA